MALKLEVFDTTDRARGPASASSQTVVMDTTALEDSKLASYDQGYAAGWEDATSAQSDDQTKMRSDLARSLQTLSFTYHDARQHVMRALEPLITGMVGRLLPELARQSMPQIILETLLPLAAKVSEPPITLVLNPNARAPVEALLESETGFPVQIQEEPTLGEGQAYLRFDTGETQIDLDDAVARISAAVRDFFTLNGKDTPNG